MKDVHRPLFFFGLLGFLFLVGCQQPKKPKTSVDVMTEGAVVDVQSKKTDVYVGEEGIKVGTKKTGIDIGREGIRILGW